MKHRMVKHWVQFLAPSTYFTGLLFFQSDLLVQTVESSVQISLEPVSPVVHPADSSAHRDYLAHTQGLLDCGCTLCRTETPGPWGRVA